MGCVSGKPEKAYAMTGVAEEAKKENCVPTPQPVVTREDYNDKHEGARNQGQTLPAPPTAPDPNGKPIHLSSSGILCCQLSSFGELN